MYPIIFNIPILGGLRLHTYGLMVALGFLAGILWVSFRSRKEGLPPEKMMDLCFYIILSAVFGSRLVYALVEEPSLIIHPLDFFKIWEGGLVFYGGLMASVATSGIFMWKHRLNFWKVADVFVPGVALGHAFGRIGCFMAGCCYGKPVLNGKGWGVIFPDNPDSLAPAGVALYPTQLLESGAEFFIFAILVYQTRQKKFDGQILLMYLILYSIVRSILEMFRGDLSRGFVFNSPLSTSQFISLILIVVSIILWVWRARQAHPHSSGRLS